MCRDSIHIELQPPLKNTITLMAQDVTRLNRIGIGSMSNAVPPVVSPHVLGCGSATESARALRNTPPGSPRHWIRSCVLGNEVLSLGRDILHPLPWRVGVFHLVRMPYMKSSCFRGPHCLHGCPISQDDVRCDLPGNKWRPYRSTTKAWHRRSSRKRLEGRHHTRKEGLGEGRSRPVQQ